MLQHALEQVVLEGIKIGVRVYLDDIIILDLTTKDVLIENEGGDKLIVASERYSSFFFCVFFSF
jgi:hypothetical protein